MKRMMRWFITTLATAMIVAAAVGIGSAFAQEPATTPDSEQVTPPADKGFGPHGPRGHGGLGVSHEHLADALGITVEELEAAIAEARAAALADAVADGRITQEQADMVAARAALAEYIDHHALLADVLGMSVAELEEAQAAGQRLDEIVEAQGLTMEEARAAVQAAHEAAVQQAVSDGVITQEQADQFLSGEGRRGPGFGGRGRGPDGPGGPRGPGFAPDFDRDSDTRPSTLPGSDT